MHKVGHTHAHAHTLPYIHHSRSGRKGVLAAQKKTKKNQKKKQKQGLLRRGDFSASGSTNRTGVEAGERNFKVIQVINIHRRAFVVMQRNATQLLGGEGGLTNHNQRCGTASFITLLVT